MSVVYEYLPREVLPMPAYTAEELLIIASNFDDIASDSILKEAKWKGKGLPPWLLKKKKVDKTDANSAKDKSAKCRNRGDVCFPAEGSGSGKDHFPINDIDQACNALSQVGKYTKAPPWYKGTLESLKNTVSRKVHSKYPSIGKEKSANLYVRESLLVKYATDVIEIDDIDDDNKKLVPPKPVPGKPVPPKPVGTTFSDASLRSRL
jgi:hypothetical protein